METEEITLVQVINGEELCTEQSKVFESYDEAKDYFASILQEFGITENHRRVYQRWVLSGYNTLRSRD